VADQGSPQEIVIVTETYSTSVEGAADQESQQAIVTVTETY